MIHDQRDENSDEATALAPEVGPLPPIPDGGLAEVMPSWLRDAQETAPVTSADRATASASSPEPCLDPAAFITEDDLPDWLRQLSPTGSPPVPTTSSAVPVGPPAAAPSTRATASSSVPPSLPRPPASMPQDATGRPLSPTPSPPVATKPPMPPRRDPEPSHPPTGLTTRSQAPAPEVRQDEPNRGVIIGVVLVLIAAGIIVYLFARGIL